MNSTTSLGRTMPGELKLPRFQFIVLPTEVVEFMQQATTSLHYYSNGMGQTANLRVLEIIVQTIRAKWSTYNCQFIPFRISTKNQKPMVLAFAICYEQICKIGIRSVRPLCVHLIRFWHLSDCLWRTWLCVLLAWSFTLRKLEWFTQAYALNMVAWNNDFGS